MPFTVLIAPSGFKESLDVNDVVNAIESGVKNAIPSCHILKVPMVDGGEGFTQGIINATNGTIHNVCVTGPVGQPVKSFFGFMGGAKKHTAVIEMAAAAGLRLVPKDMRDPTKTSSRGVGELIIAALDAGAKRILIGCGDSGINDGGAGMAQALGASLLDEQGQEIGNGGAELARLAKIDITHLDPRLKHVPMDVAVNWHNILLGPKGVARVFGPQKGATQKQVELLEEGLENYATCIKKNIGLDVGFKNGSGASGGLGAGLVAFAEATLHPRFDVIMQYLDFDNFLYNADIVITAEGSLDKQTPYGKIPCEVARRAETLNIPTIALAGMIGKGAVKTLENGIDAFTSIVKGPCTLEEALEKGDKFLRYAAEDAIRMIMVGVRMQNNFRSKTENAA